MRTVLADTFYWIPFLLGVLAGVLCAVAIAVWAAFHLAGWLVVGGEARRADLAVVLGGGGGSRLRKGLELYVLLARMSSFK